MGHAPWADSSVFHRALPYGKEAISVLKDERRDLLQMPGSCSSKRFRP
jgi:hypothetical protein